MAPMLRLDASALDYAIIRAPVVAQPTGVSEEDEAAAAPVANRFDIRRIIAGVFTVYGTILLARGQARTR